MEFSIELYETADGRPVVEAEFETIQRQSPVLHALLLAGLVKLRWRDNHRLPLCKPMGDGLFELRVGGRDIARALWFFRAGQRIVVVHCFVKKSQRTPTRELELARKRMAEYQSRRS